MADLKFLKQTIDLRVWVERDLGQPPMRRGSGDNAWNFRCPFHNEQKGASLVVYKEYWRCYGACSDSGDILTWIAKRERLELTQREDFRKVITLLGGDPEALPTRPLKRSASPVPPTPALPPGEQWQAIATEIVETAERRLWSAAGREARQYLMEQRGLHEQTLREGRLGYLPAEEHYPHIERGMKIPAYSITIPWFAQGALWGVKCRLLGGGELRYLYFTADKDHKAALGSANINGSLYWADHIAARKPVLIVEGEFNCLSIWEAAGDLVCPVSLGTSGQGLNVRWLASLITAPTILTWFDADDAGRHGTKRLAALASYLRPVILPDGVGKDLNDFWCLSQRQHRPEAIRDWLLAALASWGK